MQLGNKIKVHYNSKNEDRIGYFSLELIENNSIKFFIASREGEAWVTSTTFRISFVSDLLLVKLNSFEESFLAKIGFYQNTNATLFS